MQTRLLIIALLLISGSVNASNMSDDGKLSTFIEKARADLMTRISSSKIETDSAEPMVWSDGSLGCPQPGVEYTQAEVSGFRIILRAENKLWDYRAGAKGGVVLCDAPMTDKVRGNPAK